MTVAHRAPRCSDGAGERGDPRAGSAVPVTRWFLLEQPGPWGRDALMSSRLGSRVAGEVSRRAGAAGARVLLVRRHGRAGHVRQGRRHWALVDSRPGSEAVRWGRFEEDDELLDVRLDGPVEPHRHEGPGDPDSPVYLACAHGRHDTCCAVRGREVAAALDELAPGRVWECSHVGGCRFAANVVVLPHGLYYGGVTPASAPGLVEATEHGRVVPGLLRGRSSLPAAVQAAQHHAREVLLGQPLDAGPGTVPDLMAVDALRPLGSTPRDDGAVTVALAVDVDRVLEVTVRQAPSAPPALLTCAATRPTSPLGWQLVDVRDRG
ncbi:sucrase ferredoxin [Aquipuribacter hungaricus]|uniref:Sucrase ferredoxin n=1 Tax=Aquipuribacter hungaricus TaxID=545624 RepID=A0ABV7WKM8_9MICO